MDAWSSRPALSQKKWLISAWALGRERSRPHFRVAVEGEGPGSIADKVFPVPSVDYEAMSQFADEMIAMFLAVQKRRGEIGFTERKAIEQALEALIGGEAPRWLEYQVGKAYAIMRRRRPGGLTEAQVRSEVVLGFLATGSSVPIRLGPIGPGANEPEGVQCSVGLVDEEGRSSAT